MDIFSTHLVKITHVVQGKHGVFVDAITDTYGAQMAEALYFSNEIWPRIHARMMFLETERNGEDYGHYVESLSDDEYYRRFEHDIHKFTDEELVAEVNRRVKTASMLSAGRIVFETKVVYKKNLILGGNSNA